MTSSVLKMMIVSIIMCPVQALCGFCGYCSSGRLAREPMTDCPVVKLRRRVLFLCGRESSYTGGKGMGFLEADRKTMLSVGKGTIMLLCCWEMWLSLTLSSTKESFMIYFDTVFKSPTIINYLSNITRKWVIKIILL